MTPADPPRYGRFLVELDHDDGPHDHPIERPRVTDTVTGAVLLDMWLPETWDWDARPLSWEGPVLALHLRRFPGTLDVMLKIDADTRKYYVRGARWRPGLRPLVRRLHAAGLTRF